MKSCCICQFAVRNPKDIFSERIGKPAIIISDLVLQCTRGTDFDLDTNTTICEKCCEKLTRYYKAIEEAKRWKVEILQLIRSAFTIHEFEEPLSKSGTQADDDNGDNNLHNFDSKNSTKIKEEVVDVIAKDVPQMEQFLLVTLDIKPDIIPEEDDPMQVTIRKDYDEKHESSDNDDDDIDFNVTDDDEGSEYSEERRQCDSKIKCSNCDATFKNKRKYNAHVKREHFTGYKCDKCDKTLQSYAGFNIHMKNHEPEKQFECPECGKRFNQKVLLKYHMDCHSGERPFQCEICSKRFVHKVGLCNHKKIHDTDTKRLECEVCGAKFRTKAHLERHMRSHTGVKPFACPVCKKCFSQMYNMKAHLREHEKRGCDETFNGTHKYDEHVKGKNARYVCDQCGKTMLSYTGFIGHVQNHETVKQHECPECGERFNQKIRLNYHMTKHTGETPYGCNICFKQFAHANNLYKHKQIHNEQSKRLECKHCDRKFRTKYHLTRHSRVHSGAKPHSCTICDKTFAQSNNLRLHMKIHEKKGSRSK